MSDEETKKEDFETKAKEMGGFISKEEWVAKGKDPDKWRDPETFVKRGENIIPILQDRLKKAEQDLEVFMKHSEAEIERVKKDTYERAKADYEEKIEKVKALKKEAFEAMDFETFEKAEAQEKKLKPPEEPTKKKKDDFVPPKDFVTWQNDNGWWEKDKTMTAFARAISGDVQIEMGLPDGIALYNEVTKRVKKAFPDSEYFVNKKREEPGVVEGDSPLHKTSSKKGFNDLPKTAKDSYYRFQKKFELKGKKLEKDQWAQDYFAQEA